MLRWSQNPGPRIGCFNGYIIEAVFLGDGRGVYYYMEEWEMNICDQENKLWSILLWFPTIHYHFLERGYISFLCHVSCSVCPCDISSSLIAGLVHETWWNWYESLPAEVLRAIAWCCHCPFPFAMRLRWGYSFSLSPGMKKTQNKVKADSQTHSQPVSNVYLSKKSIFLFVSHHWSVT